MIDALFGYIKGKGFECRVEEGMILMRKKWRDRYCYASWSITQTWLNTSYPAILYLEADGYMRQIDEMIAKEETTQWG